MKAPQIFGAAIVLLSISCHYMPRETNAPSTKPCPKPDIDTGRWKIVAVDDCGIRLRLPRGYGGGEGGGANEWVQHAYRSGELNSIHVSFHAEKVENVSELKVLRPTDAEGFEDCNETINGHAALLQSYRGGGTVG